MSVTRPASPPAAAALLALAAATDRLLATIDAMTVRQFAEPSLLPGWSRAHVLAHLALNAKGMAGVLTKLDGPDPLPMYASDQRRDSDIDRLAAQPAARIADRVAVGAAVLATHLGGGPTPEDALEAVGRAGSTAAELPPDRRATSGPADAGGPTDAGGSTGHGVAPTPFARAAIDHAAGIEAWAVTGTFERTPGGRAMSAAQLPLMRWREVEIHHADLGLDYGPGDWPAEFADYLFAVTAFDRDGERSMTLVPAGHDPVVLTGPSIARVGSAGAAVGDPAPDDPQPAAGDAGLRVHGTSADLAWWLAGRGSGEGLAASGDPLPNLGPWVRR